MKQVGISSIGAAAPDKILTNFDLEKMIDTSDEWIVTRTGIRERRVLAPDDKLLDLLTDASRTACSKANVDAAKLDFVITSTLSPDRICPAQACEVAHDLQVRQPFCFDLNIACSGFLYGLALAESLLKTRDISCGLVTSGEQMTRMTNYQDRTSCIIFGDGAAAAVVTNDQPQHLILSSEMGADPSMAGEVVIGGIKDLTDGRSEDFYFRQNGKVVFKFAVSKIKEMYETVPAKVGLRPEQVKYIIPHQANSRIIDAAAKEITAQTSTEFLTNLDRYGNTSSASIGLMLNESWDRFQKGDYILLIGFGGGLAWSAVLLQW
ncbi:MAG: beta-ketoacyl-ACP synthase 3 [Bacillota bacterium]|jgi:3-oxoacyl-[acyl-carrier-protein] synthase-3